MFVAGHGPLKYGQHIHCNANQSAHWVPKHWSFGHWIINPSGHQLILMDQSIDWSINWLIHLPIHSWVDRPTDQSIDWLINWLINWSVRQLVNKWINQAFDQTIQHYLLDEISEGWLKVHCSNTIIWPAPCGKCDRSSGIRLSQKHQKPWMNRLSRWTATWQSVYMTILITVVIDLITAVTGIIIHSNTPTCIHYTWVPAYRLQRQSPNRIKSENKVHNTHNNARQRNVNYHGAYSVLRSLQGSFWHCWRSLLLCQTDVYTENVRSTRLS